MAKQEVTRTPDKLQGAENASRAIANVLNFTLGREIQQERQRQAMEAVAQQQEFRKRLQQQEQEAAFARLQTDLASRNVINERLEERKQAELEELRDYHNRMLANEREQTRSMAALRKAQESKYQRSLKEETLAQSIDERIRQLNALSPYMREGNSSAMMRSNMIMQELIPLQNELDRIRAGETLSPDIGRKIYEGQRKGFREYIRTNVREPIETSLERLEELRRKEAEKKGEVFKEAPDLDTLNRIATGADTTKAKSPEDMTDEEYFNYIMRKFSQ
jgi:hypothetical protein